MLSYVIGGVGQLTAELGQQAPIRGVTPRDALCLSHWSGPAPAERYQLCDWSPVDGHRDSLPALHSSQDLADLVSQFSDGDGRRHKGTVAHVATTAPK